MQSHLITKPKQEPAPIDRQHHRDYWNDEYYIDQELSEAAERQLDKLERESGFVEITDGKIFCGHCGTKMSLEKLGARDWQVVCSYCGTSGPRADNKEEAMQNAFALFPD